MADYISRPDIMGKLTAGDAQNAVREMSGGEAYNWFLEIVNGAPSADVEPMRHGKWETHQENDEEFGYVRWSECSLCHVSIGASGRLQYCPHCGAKMDLEAQTDDN